MKDLTEFIKVLEDEGEIVRVKEELSPRFEIPAFSKMLAERDGQAALFEKVTGYSVPVVGNLLGTRRRLAYALGVKEKEISQTYLEGRNYLVAPEIVDSGPVKEVRMADDINILRDIPVLTHHEKDAGPYFTCAITVAKDPETGTRGMGIHRIQVRGKDRVGIFLATPPLSRFLAKAEETGKPLEIAIVNGVEPVTFLSSVIWAPVGVDKFAIAGGIAKRPVQLVKCETVDLEVPAFAQFVLEGYIIPKDREKEGPFGESSGYYLTYNNPVGIIKAITHRTTPIYHDLMPFAGEEAVLLGLSWELDNLAEARKSFPFVKKVSLTRSGLTMIVIVQIEKTTEGEVRQIIEHFFQQHSVKIVIVVDDDIDIYDIQQVLWAVATRTKPVADVLIQDGLPGQMIDPTSPQEEYSADSLYTVVSRVSKMGIDATKPLTERERFEKVDVPSEVRTKIGEMLKRYLAF